MIVNNLGGVSIWGNKLLLLVFTTCYSFVGILFYHWSIFFIVYLFWFESVMGIIFSYIKYKSALHIEQPKAGRPSYINALKGRLFFNLLYFVFIFLALGIAFPFLLFDEKEMSKAIVTNIGIILFSDWNFNLALILCIGKELIDYIRDFKLNPIYTSTNPLPSPSFFEKRDLIIHLTIIFGIGLSMLIKHPDLKTLGSMIPPNYLSVGPGIIFIIIKFFVDFWGYAKSNKKEVIDDEVDMIDV